MNESPLSPIMIPNICGKPEIYSMPVHLLSRFPTTRDRLCDMPSVIYPSARSYVLNQPGVAGLPRAWTLRKILVILELGRGSYGDCWIYEYLDELDSSVPWMLPRMILDCQHSWSIVGCCIGCKVVSVFLDCLRLLEYSLCNENEPRSCSGDIGGLSTGSSRYSFNSRNVGVSPHLHLEVYLNSESIEGSILPRNLWILQTQDQPDFNHLHVNKPCWSPVCALHVSDNGQNIHWAQTLRLFVNAWLITIW